MQLFRTVWAVVTLMLAAVELAEMKRDYYDVLGVDRKATTQQIKRAFRKQAAKYHPDKNKDPGAEDKFKEINEANEVLSDEEKRKRYDMFGHEGQPGAAPQWQEGPAGHGGFQFTFDDDLFRNFFGQEFGGEKFHFNQREFHGRQPHQGHQHHNFFSFNDFFEEEDFPQRTFGDFFGERDPHRFGGGSSYFGSHYGGGHHNHHEPRAYQQQSRWRSSGHTGTRCKTVTQRIGNTVTTYTQCS
ncbi:dnaJ homolog subfamily B member 9-like [Macrosteles quadrilineatus]|uniref:dnaJ homolog subfamily B member 9-like n=1 Tax=Macrosteles quadrilineatus TaxID=74068 RepID=UPI0023E182C0|nr:dnaJ homolog subfamily B member 9-like [Macrosteles quadrilineatus]